MEESILEEEKVKVPFHHASKEYKELADKGLIDENKMIKVSDLPEGYFASKEGDKETKSAVSIEKIIEDRVKEAEERLEQKYQQKENNTGISQNYAPLVKPAFIIDRIPELKDWVVKDRKYVLTGGLKPIDRSIQRVGNTQRSLQYSNIATGEQYPMRWCSNQSSFFVEEQSKNPQDNLDAEIRFSYGTLFVPKENTLLQKFLAIHQDRGVIFEEYDETKETKSYVNSIQAKSKCFARIKELNKHEKRSVVCLLDEAYVPSWLDLEVEASILRLADEKPSDTYLEMTKHNILTKGFVKECLLKEKLFYRSYEFFDEHNESIIKVPPAVRDHISFMAEFLESGEGRTLYHALQNM